MARIGAGLLGRLSTRDDDGAIGLITYAADFIFIAIYGLVVLYSNRFLGNFSQNDKYLLFCFASLWSVILIFIDIPLMFLRLYFFTDIVIAFFAWQLSYRIDNYPWISMLFALFSLPIGLMYILLTIQRTPWFFERSFLETLLGFPLV